MSTLQIISDHPFISLFALAIVVDGLGKIINRIFRHWNIRKHGYPPAHCDADGDFKPSPDKDTEGVKV